MTSGIYIIINLINNKIYVGSAINFTERWRSHQYSLNNNIHGNEHLQRAWNFYGSDVFQFTIVEEVQNKSKLLEIEQLWLDASDCCNSEIGYNILPVAGSNLGIEWSDDYKEKMSKRLKGKIKSPEWQASIKNAILKSNKSFKNKRNVEKWPHEKGNRCNCKECRKKAYITRTEETKKYYTDYAREYARRQRRERKQQESIQNG